MFGIIKKSAFLYLCYVVVVAVVGIVSCSVGLTVCLLFHDDDFGSLSCALQCNAMLLGNDLHSPTLLIRKGNVHLYNGAIIILALKSCYLQIWDRFLGSKRQSHHISKGTQNCFAFVWRKQFRLWGKLYYRTEGIFQSSTQIRQNISGIIVYLRIKENIAEYDSII